MDKLRKQLMLVSDDLKHETAKLFQQHKSQALQHTLCHGAWLFLLLAQLFACASLFIKASAKFLICMKH